jgi:hypothetical protein
MYKLIPNIILKKKKLMLKFCYKILIYVYFLNVCTVYKVKRVITNDKYICCNFFLISSFTVDIVSSLKATGFNLMVRYLDSILEIIGSILNPVVKKNRV